MLRELSPHEQAFVARLMSQEQEGYHGGWPSLDGMAAAIFDGTPRAFRTLYLCEWLQWCCLHWLRDDADWSHLLALRATIRAAHCGAPIPDLAKELPDPELEAEAESEAQVRAPAAQHRERFVSEAARGRAAGQMRGYLYALAKAGMRDRALAGALIDVWGESRLHGPWHEIAESMQRLYQLVHPAEHAADRRTFRFSDRERAALAAYFDMYLLGFERAEDGRALDAHWEHIQQAMAWIERRRKELLAPMSHPEFMRNVGLSVPPNDPGRKAELADRYHYQCGCLRIRFWEAGHRELAWQSSWDESKPFVAWMAETDALLAQVFDGFLKHFFALYPGLLSESVEQMVQYLFRYHINLKRPDEKTLSLPTRTMTVRLEPEPSSGRVIARLYRDGKATKLLELQLLTSVGPSPSDEAHAPVGDHDPGIRFKRMRRAMTAGNVRQFKACAQTLSVYDDQSPELDPFSKALAAAGALLKVGMAVTALAQALRENELKDVDDELFVNVTLETLQALDPGTALLAPLLARAGSGGANASRLLLYGATQLGRAAGFVDSMLKVVSGATTLYTFVGPASASTDLAHYLERGQALPALLETTKGMVQLAAGSAGIAGTVLGADATLATVIGTGTVLATVPLGIVVAVGAVAVAMLDVVIYVDTGGSSPVQAFMDRARRARRAQFALVPDEKDPDDRREASTRVVCTAKARLIVSTDVAILSIRGTGKGLIER